MDFAHPLYRVRDLFYNRDIPVETADRFCRIRISKTVCNGEMGDGMKQGYRLICMALGLFLLLAGTGCSAAPEAVEAGGILWFCQPASG